MENESFNRLMGRRILFLKRLTLTAMGHGGCRLFLLNFELILYFCKMNKK
jgi:hypothetical protein